MNKRLWIVPQNDLEAQTIIELLKRNGEEVLISNQKWGASWDNLEPEIQEEISKRKKVVSKKVEIPEDDYQMDTMGSWEMTGRVASVSVMGADVKTVSKTYHGTREQYLMSPESIDYREEQWNYKGKLHRGAFHGYREIQETVPDTDEVYGIELQGDTKCKNIDHHKYGDDDRTNPKSSLEQVAEILQVELTLMERFIAANDRGYIPAMEKLGKELGLTNKELERIISTIRLREREIQGITKEQEAQAEEAIKKLGNLSEKRRYIEVDLPHSKTATITDRLYRLYDELLVVSGDGETNFFGSTEIIRMLEAEFPGGWSGGNLENGQGFWGGYADQDRIRAAVREKIDEMIRREEQEKEQEQEMKNTVTKEEDKKENSPLLARLRNLIRSRNID